MLHGPQLNVTYKYTFAHSFMNAFKHTMDFCKFELEAQDTLNVHKN